MSMNKPIVIETEKDIPADVEELIQRVPNWDGKGNDMDTVMYRAVGDVWMKDGPPMMEEDKQLPVFVIKNTE